MGLKIESTRVAVTTGAGPQTIDITGFGTPKLAFFYWVRAASGTEFTTDANICIGYTDGTTQRCWNAAVQDGQTTADTRRMSSTDRVGILKNFADNTVDSEIGFNSWSSNGVVLDIDDAPPSGYYVIVELWGGTDIDWVDCGHQDDLGTTATSTNITAGGGDQADLVFMVQSMFSTPPASPFDDNSNGLISYGVWSRNDSTQAMAVFAEISGGSGGAPCNYFDGDKISAQQIVGGGGAYLCTASAHASGFTITTSAGAGSDVVGWVAIKWATTPSIKIVTSTLPASAADWEESGIGFQPEFAKFCFTAATVDGTRKESGDCEFMVGTIQASQVLTCGIASEVNAGTSNVSQWSQTSFFIGDPDAATTKVSGGLSSLDSDGFTVGISGTHDSVARLGWTLGIKAASTEAPYITPLPQRNVRHSGRYF